MIWWELIHIQDLTPDVILFNFSHFLDLMYCGNGDAELWSAALLESVIIPSGQSVWHSAVAFQSPPLQPPGEAQLPAPSTGEGWSQWTNTSVPVLFSFVLSMRDYHTPTPPEDKVAC